MRLTLIESRTQTTDFGLERRNMFDGANGDMAELVRAATGLRQVARKLICLLYTSPSPRD